MYAASKGCTNKSPTARASGRQGPYLTLLQINQEVERAPCKRTPYEFGLEGSPSVPSAVIMILAGCFGFKLQCLHFRAALKKAYRGPQRIRRLWKRTSALGSILILGTLLGGSDLQVAA